MTLSESLSSAVTMPSGSGPRVLAAALSHLLRRDEECPARWRTTSFVEAVEVARSELRSPASFMAGAGVGAAHDIDFHDAVARLARYPGDVAIAIRHLELAERRPLPPWLDLVRHGLPSRASDLDVALWFGDGASSRG